MNIRNTSKTKEELLLNTINHFNSTNRCLDDSGNCVYRFKDRGCAIGIEVSDELAMEFDKLSASEDGTSVVDNRVFNALPERLSNMGPRFLVQVQALHDRAIDWDDDGVSKYGKESVNDIIKEYSLDLPLFEIE